MHQHGTYGSGEHGAYEGSIRVPMVMQWAARLAANSTFAPLVLSLDLFATIATIAGVLPSQPLDGLDLMPFLPARDDEGLLPLTIQAASGGQLPPLAADGGSSAADGGGSVVVLRSEAMEAARPYLCWWSGTVRTAAWKMVYKVTSTHNGVEWEHSWVGPARLYDMSSIMDEDDLVGETQAAARPELVLELQAAYVQWFAGNAPDLPFGGLLEDWWTKPRQPPPVPPLPLPPPPPVPSSPPLPLPLSAPPVLRPPLHPPVPPPSPTPPPPPARPPALPPVALCVAWSESLISVRQMSPPQWCSVFHGNESFCKRAYVRKSKGKVLTRCWYTGIEGVVVDGVMVTLPHTCQTSDESIDCLLPPSPPPHPPPTEPGVSLRPTSPSAPPMPAAPPALPPSIPPPPPLPSLPPSPPPTSPPATSPTPPPITPSTEDQFPDTSPPTPPPITPSTDDQFPGCSASDLLADFDSNGRATLGDAVYVGRERMTYGTTGVHTLTCMQGDFDGDGSFSAL